LPAKQKKGRATHYKADAAFHHQPTPLTGGAGGTAIMPDRTCPNQPPRKSLRTFTLEVVHALPNVPWACFARLSAGALQAVADVDGVGVELTFDPASGAWGLIIGPDVADLQQLVKALTTTAEGVR